MDDEIFYKFSKVENKMEDVLSDLGELEQAYSNLKNRLENLYSIYDGNLLHLDVEDVAKDIREAIDG